MEGKRDVNIVTVVSQKGGVGKSTLAWNLAVAAVHNGVSTLVLDSDPQQSLATLHDRRIENGYPAVPEVLSIQPLRVIPIINKAKADGYDLIIIDTPAGVDPNSAQLSQAGQVMLIPTTTVSIDLQAVRASIQLAERANRPSTVIINKCPPVGGAGADAAAYVEEQLNMAACPVRIVQRAIFGHVTDEGLGVIEKDPASKASQEINALWDWVRQALAEIAKEQKAASKSVA